jgi:hypothetical protein
MPGKNASLSRENAANRTQMLAEIGRRLRKEYDAPLPLPDRLAALVKKIEQSTEGE